MKEKKEIRITLGTFVVGIIAIILLVLVVIMGMYIATITTSKDKQENLVNDTITENKENSLKIEQNLATQKKNIKLVGDFLIKMPIDFNSTESEENYSDEGITLDENGNCSIYQGWGSSLSGNFYIENEKELICNINVRNDESGGPLQTKVDITIKYEIIEENILKLDEIMVNDDSEWKKILPDKDVIWGESLKEGNIFIKVNN